jgi:hypothetical protein
VNDTDSLDTATARPGAGLRRITAAVVVLVAGIAAVVSYRHGLEVVRAAGETGRVAYLVPGSADGVIFAASMVILSAAKNHVRVPRLAIVGLAFGIGATLAMNVAAGARHGIAGALVSAMPAVALVLAYELLMILVRGGQPAAPRGQKADTDRPCPHGVAKTPDEAIVNRWLHARDCEGETLSRRQLAADFGMHRDKVAKLVAPYAEKGPRPVLSVNGSGPS